ncbi:MAG: phosphoribosylglycinamide formyltransferase 2, partial [Opitutae bacterium]|nr:phosphoribosylglycinamide formyltransferase 2 [Opitutae bacterium]
GNLDQALSQPDTQLRLFGKPQVSGQRRMGVALARGDSIDQAREKANAVSSAVSVDL